MWRRNVILHWTCTKEKISGNIYLKKHFVKIVKSVKNVQHFSLVSSVT